VDIRVLSRLRGAVLEALRLLNAIAGISVGWGASYNRRMPGDTHRDERDNGLRRMLIWTFVALVASVLLAVLGVNLVIHFFDRPGA
jgi:hypothetical protein